MIDESTGDLKNTYQVLSEVSRSWEDMSKAEQSALALSLAGKTQISVFTSVLSNFDTAIQANNTSMASWGSAMEENAKRADSLEAKTNAFRAELENLVLGKGGLTNLLKMLVDTGTALLKFANSDLGKATIGLTSFSVILKSIPILLKTFGASTVALKLGLDATTISTIGLSGAIKALTAAMMANPIFIGALVISSAFALSQIIDQSTESAEEMALKVDELTTSLKGLKDERDALAKNSNLTEAQQQRLRLLEAEIANNERILQQEREKAYLQFQNTQNGNTGTSNFSVGYSASGGNVFDNSGDIREQASLNALVLAYNDLKNVQAETLDQEKELQDQKDKLVGAIIPYVKQLQEWKDNQVELVNGDEVLLEYLIKEIEAYGYNVEAVNAQNEALREELEATELTQEAVDELAKTLGISSDEFYENAEALGLSNSQYAQYALQNKNIQSEIEKTNSSIDELQSALGIAQTAWEEYSEGGALTLDTFQSLLNISPQYLGALINENGQISINKETLGGLVEQLKITKIEELQTAAAADILAYANGNIGEMSDIAKSAVSGLGDNVSTAGEKAGTASGKMLNFAASTYAAVQAMSGLSSGELLSEEKIRAGVDAIINSYKDIASGISKLGVDTSNNVASGVKKTGDKSKKAAKSTTDAYKEEYQKQLDDLDHKLAMGEILEEEYYASLQALNEKYFGVASGQHQKYLDEYQKNEEKIYKWQQKQQEESLKKQKETYDKALDYIRDSLQKKADLIKKDKDAELKDIDEEIKLIEKRRDRELKAVKERIKATKEERDTLIDGLNEQIDVLSDLMDKEKEEWNLKINAFKEQNKLLDEQIELQKLQEALAKAKSSQKYIFKDGKFRWGQDESAVSEAEQNLEVYYNELKQQKELEALENARDAALNIYEEQIASLKSYKETMSKQYDEEIERLEQHQEQLEEYYDRRLEKLKEHREEVEEEYNAQIEMMENYIENFDNMVNEYDEKQSKLALIQLKGAEAEKETWMMRLENLRDFVNEYNRLQSELDGGSTDNEVSYGSGSSSSSSGSSGGPGTRDIFDIIGRASGDASVKNDGMYAVGEDPNKELVIGSKLNGSLLNLAKGTGVVNAESTRTVAGILNSLPSSLGLQSFKENKRSDGTTNSLIIDKLYVQADNSKEFLDSMTREFKVKIKQDTFAFSN